LKPEDEHHIYTTKGQMENMEKGGRMITKKRRTSKSCEAICGGQRKKWVERGSD